MTALKLPSWVEKLVPGQWYEIPNTAPNSVMASRQILGAWNSFSLDPSNSKIWSVACGGHSDWAGNQVDMFNSESETPSWTEVRASDHNGVETCVSYYASGSPCARHTYYGHLFNAIDNRIMLCGGTQSCSTGASLTTMDSYNIGSNTFNAAGTHPDVPTDFQNPDCSYTSDPATGDIYGNAVNTFVKWTQSNNTWSTLTGGTTAQGGCPSAFDTMRRRVFFLGGDGFPSGAHDYYDVGQAAWTNVNITGPRASSVIGQQQASMVYVPPPLDGYVIRQHPAGNDVIFVDADRFIAYTMPTIIDGTSLQDNSPYTDPNNDGAGPYNKFLYSPRLQGALFINGYNFNVFFLRLHRDSQTPFSRVPSFNQRSR